MWTKRREALSWKNKDMLKVLLKRKGRKGEWGKREAEDVGSRLEEPKEHSDPGWPKSDCELDGRNTEDQQSEVQEDGSKDSEHAG